MLMLNNNNAVGIDIGDDAIRIIAIRARGGSYTVTHANYIPFSADQSPVDLAEALARIPHAARGNVVIAIPASGCALKMSRLPAAKPAELAQVLKFEAETQFPLPLDDLVWGYALTPGDPGFMQATLVGARRTLVEERMTTLQDAGLAPKVVLVASLAAAMALPQQEGPSLVVVAGTEWSDLCLLEAGRVQGCRSILAGSPSVEGWAERIAREIRPWMANSTLSRVQLLGDVPREAANYLSTKLEVPVSQGDPWWDVNRAGDMLEAFDETPTSFATAVGLAKAAFSRQYRINLLPAQVLETRRHTRKLALTLGGLIVLAAVLALIASQTSSMLQERQRQLEKVHALVQTAKRAMPIASTDGLPAAKQTLEALDKPESNPLELLRLLSADLPTGITLESFSFDRGRAVVLKGRATSDAVLSSAVKAINQMTIIDRAMLDYSNAASEKNSQGYDFQITCTLPSAPDATTALQQGHTHVKTMLQTNNKTTMKTNTNMMMKTKTNTKTL